MQHGKASDHAGKKVVVVGACTSGTYPYFTRNPSVVKDFETNKQTNLAHDICVDYADHGIGIAPLIIILKNCSSLTLT